MRASPSSSRRSRCRRPPARRGPAGAHRAGIGGLTGSRAALLVLAVALVGGGCGGPRATRSAVSGPASVVRERQVGPRQLDLTIRSPALGTTAMVRLLTPPGWSRRKPGHWPVLYLLHGCCDTYRSWSRSTDIAQMVPLRRVLVVMPEAGAVGFYSNWLGSSGRHGPAWETFHLGELPRILARGYGAGRPRAIAGLSMGGLGAMAYAARHPGMFRAAASFSGLLHPLADPGIMTGLFASHTADPKAIWGDPRRDHDVWAAHDPTELAGALRGVRLFMSAGDGRPGPLDSPATPRDNIEPTTLREGRAFLARLRAARIPARVDFYGPGTHTWPYWQRELRRALPVLLAGNR
jgi:diacylglycerol O-acyltransferase/trehalose O-mycolyltransferase